MNLPIEVLFKCWKCGENYIEEVLKPLPELRKISNVTSIEFDVEDLRTIETDLLNYDEDSESEYSEYFENESYQIIGYRCGNCKKFLTDNKNKVIQSHRELFRYLTFGRDLIDLYKLQREFDRQSQTESDAVAEDIAERYKLRLKKLKGKP